MISVNKDTSVKPTVFMDGLNFLNSFWILNRVNLNMINCRSSALLLELRHLTNASMQNSTVGNWTFKEVQNAMMKNCYNLIDEGISTSLNFYNSSGIIQNIRIENENIIAQSKISVAYFSFLHIEQSYFVNNTVKQGVINVVNSSSLIMSNCTMQRNNAQNIAVPSTRAEVLYTCHTLILIIMEPFLGEEQCLLKQRHFYRLKIVHSRTVGHTD